MPDVLHSSQWIATLDGIETDVFIEQDTGGNVVAVMVRRAFSVFTRFRVHNRATSVKKHTREELKEAARLINDAAGADIRARRYFGDAYEPGDGVFFVPEREAFPEYENEPR